MIIEKLTEALKNKFETELREGVHVSDLCLCPRQAAERRLNPKPLTMRELNFFTSGRGIGDAIAILAKSNSTKFIIEHEVKHKNIVAHVDIYDSEHNIPIECKSARMKEMREPKSHYVEQLKSYMAMLNADKGIILVQLLLNYDDKPFVEFEITMSAEERKTQLQKLERLAASFENALNKKNIFLTEGVFKNQDLNWLCRYCPLFNTCKQGGDLVS